MLPASSERFSTSPAAEDGAQHEAAWRRATERLRAEYGEDVYTSWFGRIALDRVEDGVAHLSVPTRFLKSWIQSHYVDRITTVLAEEAAEVARIALGVRVAAPKLAASAGDVVVAPAPRFEPEERASSPAAAGSAAPSAAREGRRLDGSPLDRRLTLDTFLVGRSNQLAHAAALQIARARPGDPVTFNPLVIHAAVGLGKTHLLQATAHAVETSGRRVTYLTAEKFMFDFVAALKAQTALTFKERLRAIDLLIIDDLQFLQGKTVQQEFGHTLNALLDGRQQVIVAADRAPSELESVDERLRSRLAGGLTLEMGSLDEELRAKILMERVAAARALHPKFDVPAEVIAFVARTVTANGRDLDGAVNRLLAHNTLTGAPISVEMAEIALRDLVRQVEPKRVKIEDIQRIVAKHYNVSRADILSSRRTQTVVRPRQVAMYLSKQMTLRSLPEIGRRFGGRDHTTVLHAVRKIDGLVATDQTLADEIELLKRLLLD
ncbi:chromosomal replication initiator protein DnaA [Methylopila jiangsuensis]|uniref:Chromosomal replication initiator protein DnaA n=1 Tax=Methylopila jiangsuensis TaxID=586230 RepID=A0A9W6JLV7_9HYPH|nr:chromosomal replication initiator protein DnaA [Methylopila jiangsuensis]MDR6284707.1 chromosomal replication initiator protein [Methylopila jiangsuensis]GLK77903.1 chromosomal replication initiator protein DnaA [Methylopila jiangsuensis]